LNGNQNKEMDQTESEIHCETFKPIIFKPVNSLEDIERHTIAWAIGTIFTIAAGVISLQLVYKHLQYYYKSEYQRCMIRIILMVPIYSLCSLFSMIFFQQSIYFDATKNCYEAFVIYEFFALLLNYLGKDDEAQIQSMQGKSVRRYPFPFGFLKFDPTKASFLINCKRMTLQYVIIHPITTILSVIFESIGVLCPE
jgi:hypothetical protein